MEINAPTISSQMMSQSSTSFDHKPDTQTSPNPDSGVTPQTNYPYNPQPSELAQTQAASEQVANDLKQEEDKLDNIYEESSEIVSSDTEQAEIIHNKASEEIENNADDKEIINDMKETISKSTRELTTKVQRSAFKYMLKEHNWINEQEALNAEQFLTIKVPKILAQKLSEALNEALGLNDEEKTKTKTA